MSSVARLRFTRLSPPLIADRGQSRATRVHVHAAAAADAAGIHRLILDHAAEGRLLPRSLDDIVAHIDRFLVASVDGEVVACVDVAPLSEWTAEVRSLVVDSAVRTRGIGRRLLDAAIARAAGNGFQRLCAFTHSPQYFVRAGFSLVPHAWLPEKLARDCHQCALFGHCGQHAVTLTLAGVARSREKSGALHG